MTSRAGLGLALAALLFAAPAAGAQAPKKADPTGTWKWKTSVMGQEVESELKLKRDGEKLTGVILGDEGGQDRGRQVQGRGGLLQGRTPARGPGDPGDVQGQAEG